MIIQSEIMLRDGWSKPILRELLGEPDLRKKIYGRSNPGCLQPLDRSIAAEATREFADAQESLSKRKASRKKAIKTKIDKLMADIAAMSVSVQVIKPAHLQQLAIDAYNEWNGERNDPASNHSEKRFLSEFALISYDMNSQNPTARFGKSLVERGRTLL